MSRALQALVLAAAARVPGVEPAPPPWAREAAGAVTVLRRDGVLQVELRVRVTAPAPLTAVEALQRAVAVALQEEAGEAVVRVLAVA